MNVLEILTNSTQGLCCEHVYEWSDQISLKAMGSSCLWWFFLQFSHLLTSWSGFVCSRLWSWEIHQQILHHVLLSMDLSCYLQLTSNIGDKILHHLDGLHFSSREQRLQAPRSITGVITTSIAMVMMLVLNFTASSAIPSRQKKTAEFFKEVPVTT